MGHDPKRILYPLILSPSKDAPPLPCTPAPQRLCGSSPLRLCRASSRRLSGSRSCFAMEIPGRMEYRFAGWRTHKRRRMGLNVAVDHPDVRDPRSKCVSACLLCLLR